MRRSTSARVSPPSGRKSRSRCHRCQTSAGMPPERLALELAVVDLDPALVHHDGRAQGEQLGRVQGAAQRARAHLGHRVVHQRTGRLGLGPTRRRSARRRSGRAGGPARWPPTHRGAPGSARSGRDENAAALLAGGHLARRQGADLLDLHRGQLEMAAVAVAADQARRTGALEAGPQGLVAVRERGRQERGLGRPRARSPRPARRRSPPGPRPPGAGAPPPAPPAGRSARAARPARRRWDPAPAWPPARAPRARPGVRSGAAPLRSWPGGRGPRSWWRRTSASR